jgi:hypothetical protein
MKRSTLAAAIVFIASSVALGLVIARDSGYQEGTTKSRLAIESSDVALFAMGECNVIIAFSIIKGDGRQDLYSRGEVDASPELQKRIARIDDSRRAWINRRGPECASKSTL